MGVKKCELCDSPARIHCESDQANLCWDCDAKVHGANFLVARHSRCLLCRRCQSPTPWRAEGYRLGGTVSVCQLCAAAALDSIEGSGEGGCGTRLCVEEEKREAEGGGGDRDEEKEDEEEEEGEEEEEEEDEESENGEEEDDIDEGENQVVPWSLTPPPVASSSSSDYEEEETGRTAGNTGVFLKRMRENAGLTVSQVNLIICLLLLHIDFSSRELLIITNFRISNIHLHQPPPLIRYRTRSIVLVERFCFSACSQRLIMIQTRSIVFLNRFCFSAYTQHFLIMKLSSKRKSCSSF